MEWIPRNFLHCCKERYIIRFSSPYFSPKDIVSNYVVWYTFPNKKQESVQVEALTTDQLVVSESPKFDKPCAVSVAVQSKLNKKVVAYFTVELLSLADYLFKKAFFPFKAITPEVVDPHIVNRILAMFMAYYCNIGEEINDERGQTDGILQTLLSQLKDHKGNLASITTGPYGTQENIIHFVLRNKLDKTARYLIRNMRGYDHLFLEQDKNHKTPLDLAQSAGFGDLDSDIKQKINAKKPLVRTQSNAANESLYENPSFHSNGNKHLRTGIIKERYKHPGLLEILEVGDTVDVISGPDGGVYEVMIRDNHCFIPEVILWVQSSDDKVDTPHTYEEIRDTQSSCSKGNSENFYMTLKSPVETAVANHYIIEPVNPPSAAVGIDERLPMAAPPRSKGINRPPMTKSATLPNPKKSAAVHKPLPYRPPPPKFNSTSATPSSPSGTKTSPTTTTISAPPRRKKSAAKEPIYEAPVVKPPPSDTIVESEECYVEPTDIAEKSNEPAEYLEISELTSPTVDDHDKHEIKETSANADSNSKAEKGDKEAVTEKSAVTDGKKTNDENVPVTDSSDQKPKEPAGDSTDTEEKNQNLTISQAKKMFEAKPQSTSSCSKVMSPTSKVIKTKNNTFPSTLESANKITKAPTECKLEAKDGSNMLPAADNDVSNNQSASVQPEAPESNGDNNQSEGKEVNNDVQLSKNLVPAKPSKPAVAIKKPHVEGSDQ